MAAISRCDLPGRQPRRWANSRLLLNQQVVGQTQSLQRERRFDQIEFGAPRLQGFGQTAGRDDQGDLTTRPLRLDAAHNAVDRVGGAEEHSGPNAFFGAFADHLPRGKQLRGRQLRLLIRS